MPGLAKVEARFSGDGDGEVILLPPVEGLAGVVGGVGDATASAAPLTSFHKPEDLCSTWTSRVFFSSMFPNHRRNCR